MEYATQCQSYLDSEGQALVDATGKSLVSASPFPSMGRSTLKRWSIIASVFSVLLVIGLVAGPGYGGRPQLGESGLDVVSLFGEEVVVESVFKVSEQLANKFKETLNAISEDIKNTRQELEAISSKKMSIAHEKFEKFTADMARASALLAEMECDVHNLYNSLADIFQLNVDDLKQKLYVPDVSVQKQAIHDAQDTMSAAIDTALDELAPLQKKRHRLRTRSSQCYRRPQWLFNTSWPRMSEGKVTGTTTGLQIFVQRHMVGVLLVSF